MARDGEVIQRQHFYHHGDTICHPSQVMWQPNCTERLHVEALTVHAKLERWQHCWIHYFSCLKFRFCPSIVSYIMIILYRGAVGYNVIGVYCWIFPKCLLQSIVYGNLWHANGSTYCFFNFIGRRSFILLLGSFFLSICSHSCLYLTHNYTCSRASRMLTCNARCLWERYEITKE